MIREHAPQIRGSLNGTESASSSVGQVEQFLGYLTNVKNSSENTIAAYRNDLGQLTAFFRPRDAPREWIEPNWATITRDKLGIFVSALRRGGYKTSSLDRKVAAVKSYFHWLTAEGRIKQDPTESLYSPKGSSLNPSQLLSPEQVDALLKSPCEKLGPGGKRDLAMMRTLYASGMQVSEMVALNVEDVKDGDMLSGSVRCIGKAGRERHVPLDIKAQKALKDYLETAHPFLTRHKGEVEALFVNHRGERLTRQGFWLILKGHAKAAGLPDDFTPETLRPSFAVHLVRNHARLQEVGNFLENPSLSTTQIHNRVA